MKSPEYKPDNLLDSRPAETPFSPKLPPDCFGRFDAPEEIIREPLSDLAPDSPLAYMHEQYAQSFFHLMQNDAHLRAYRAELRLNDFVHFHREYRLHRWNGQGVEESLYCARRSTTRLKSPPEDTSHLEDIACFHRLWATSTAEA